MFLPITVNGIFILICDSCINMNTSTLYRLYLEETNKRIYLYIYIDLILLQGYRQNSSSISNFTIRKFPGKNKSFLPVTVKQRSFRWSLFLSCRIVCLSIFYREPLTFVKKEKIQLYRTFTGNINSSPKFCITEEIDNLSRYQFIYTKTLCQTYKTFLALPPSTFYIT